jgi:L-idonate 5-dehydrogenase
MAGNKESIMKAWVLHGSRDLRREDRPRPSAAAGFAVVRVARAGICGSDIHYYQHGRIGDFVLKAPFVLGHEFAGEVVELGAGVSTLSTGDRVVVDPTIPCRVCPQCVRGRSNLCLNMKVFGSAASVPHLDGGFEEYVAAPASCCYRLPESVDYAVGALVEPLAVATHAVTRGGGVAGQRVLVSGAGAVGQTVLTVARVMGASRIAVSDPDAFARSFSLEHGADDAFDPSAPDVGARLAERVPLGFDLVFETSGSPRALDLAIRSCARGATIVQIGTPPADSPLPSNLIMSRELALLGSFRFTSIFHTVIEMIASGRFSVDHLVTNVFPMDELPQAVGTATRKGNVIKVQVHA